LIFPLFLFNKNVIISMRLRPTTQELAENACNARAVFSSLTRARDKVKLPEVISNVLVNLKTALGGIVVAVLLFFGIIFALAM